MAMTTKSSIKGRAERVTVCDVNRDRIITLQIIPRVRGPRSRPRCRPGRHDVLSTLTSRVTGLRWQPVRSVQRGL